MFSKMLSYGSVLIKYLQGFSISAASLGDGTERSTEHHPNSVASDSDSGLREGCCILSSFVPFLYRDRPPPLAAEATEVVGSHLHLHKRDGELMALPVIPVYALGGTEGGRAEH